jgi:hypothetical protein
VHLLTDASALPVLAHPRDLQNLDSLLLELKEAGVIGMEVYYQDYDQQAIERLLAIARQHDLLPLGGSDFHGIGSARERDLGDIPLPFEPVEQLVALARQRHTLLVRQSSGCRFRCNAGAGVTATGADRKKALQ